MKGWTQPVTLRFARMSLFVVSGGHVGSLAGAQEVEPEDPSLPLLI